MWYTNRTQSCLHLYNHKPSSITPARWLTFINMHERISGKGQYCYKGFSFILNSFIPCMKFARAALLIPTSTTSVCGIFVYSFASVWDFLTCAWMMMQAIAGWSCTNIIRESALKADSGRKIPHHTRELNPNQSST